MLHKNLNPKYGGLTRRQFNERKQQAVSRSGNFEVVVTFAKTPAKVDRAQFNNDLGAIARYSRLIGNPDVRFLKVVEHKSVTDSNGNTIVRAEAIHSFTRYGYQELSNGNRFWWDTHR